MPVLSLELDGTSIAHGHIAGGLILIVQSSLMLFLRVAVTIVWLQYLP